MLQHAGLGAKNLRQRSRCAGNYGLYIGVCGTIRWTVLKFLRMRIHVHNLILLIEEKTRMAQYSTAFVSPPKPTIQQHREVNEAVEARS